MAVSDSQKWLWLVALSLLGCLVYELSPVLMPFAIASCLAYLCNPLVNRLETFNFKRFHINRTMAVILVFLGISLIFAAFLIIIVPDLEYQISEFLEKLPSYLAWFNKSVIPILQKYLGRGIRSLQTNQLVSVIKTQWQAASLNESLLLSVSQSGAVILKWVMNVLLIPVITFYLLRDWDKLLTKIHNLFPRRFARLVSKLASEADAVLGAFLRGQFYVMLLLGLIYSIGLWYIDLELAMIIGMLAGLISFIPYMGVLVGLGMACISALLQFQNVTPIMPVILVFAIGHSVESLLLTPWLVGNKIGLHPVAVIFSILAGGQLFGFLGILLALPIASVIMVLLRHIHEQYTDSHFYSISKS